MTDDKISQLVKNLAKKLDDLVLKALQEAGYSVNDSNFEIFIAERCLIEKRADSKIILYVDNKEIANWTHKIKTNKDDEGNVTITYNIE
jgi:hypothetical protein